MISVLENYFLFSFACYSDKDVRDVVDYSLCELEVITGITHSKFYNPHDLANFILHLSKSVSQELYRYILKSLDC